MTAMLLNGGAVGFISLKNIIYMSFVSDYVIADGYILMHGNDNPKFIVTNFRGCLV